MTSPSPAVALALALLSLASPLSAQEPAEEETFSEVIEVSVVNLDVFVSDKKGKPLAGLRQEDFQILEDGKPVEITNFYAEERTAAPTRAAAGPAAAPAAERSPEQRLNLVIFVDDVNTRPANRGRILDHIDEFLDQSLAPGDQVMLVRYDNGLDVRRMWTADLAQVKADIDVLKGLASDRRSWAASFEHAIDDLIGAIYVEWSWGPLTANRIQAWAEQERDVVQGALNGLDSVIGWIAGVPGRKAVLYVSDGLPIIPGDELMSFAAERSNTMRGSVRVSGLSSQSNDMSQQFREVTAHASRNRVGIYPIELWGARASRGRQISNTIIANRQNGLRFLAEDTGGRVMLNAGDPISALKLMEEDLSAFYSLGYRPQRAGDDREHKIEVRVRPKGATVRHRRWYRDKSVAESVAERTAAVMRFGPEDNPLEAKLEIGEQKTKEDGGVLVPVRVKVPIAKLYLTAKDGVRTGSLRLFVVAGGEAGETPVRETRVVTVRIPEAEAAAGTGREYVHDVGITLKPGSYAVGVGVRDEAVSVTSYLRKEIAVGADGVAGK
jgi:VWFA-related protein